MNPIKVLIKVLVGNSDTYTHLLSANEICVFSDHFTLDNPGRSFRPTERYADFQNIVTMKLKEGYDEDRVADLTFTTMTPDTQTNTSCGFIPPDSAIKLGPYSQYAHDLGVLANTPPMKDQSLLEHLLDSMKIYTRQQVVAALQQLVDPIVFQNTACHHNDIKPYKFDHEQRGTKTVNDIVVIVRSLKCKDGELVEIPVFNLAAISGVDFDVVTLMTDEIAHNFNTYLISQRCQGCMYTNHLLQRVQDPITIKQTFTTNIQPLQIMHAVLREKVWKSAK